MANHHGWRDSTTVTQICLCQRQALQFGRMFWITSQVRTLGDDVNLSFHNVDGYCRNIDINVEAPMVDMRNITSIEPYALVYLSLFVLAQGENGVGLQIQLPTSAKAKQYLASQKFWERNRIRYESRFSTDNNISVIEISKEPYLGEDIGRNVLCVLESNWSDAYIIPPEEIAMLISELVDNFAQHSEAEVAYCVMRMDPQVGRLVFAIGDNGVGIRNSLSQNPKFDNLKSEPHCIVARRSLERKVSRRPEGGMGLAEVQETVVEEFGGEFFLSTGDGWVRAREGVDQIDYGTQAYDLSGVQAEISILLGGQK